MTSTLPPLTQAVAGALGSASANALTYPLDLATTRLQTTSSRNTRGIRGALGVLYRIVVKHGVSALYSGLAPDTASTITSNFLYFYAYSLLRKLALRRTKRSVLSMAQELILGFLAGVCSRLVTTPLGIITTRMQTDREEASNARDESNLATTIKNIYAERGLLGF